ncbi:hypothetical protein TcasGA2_TC034266 [Tribolium castaneum]|uniref:Uncharacterized protein n=1 Tax=Tribolium castaneum TaxID=7070 RepID=A0A139WCI9_TRICA|nr:PREDICTED: uncharacterized protein LOC103314611 [Tribolium castaneum]KYB25626.1 hypothetical protein TcasGA2_TC034266 [Tribolium castaneum]|eukprot:XP_008199280.1 PREDICTED: uncharacterized protein LOC103314611 [Tribolium castaneum]
MKFIFTILFLGVCVVVIATDKEKNSEKDNDKKHETFVEIDMILSVGLQLPDWKRYQILHQIGAREYLRTNELGYELKYKHFRDIDLTKLLILPENDTDTTGCWVATEGSAHYYFRNNGSLEYVNT